MFSLNTTKKAIWSLLFLAVTVTAGIGIYTNLDTESQDPRSYAKESKTDAVPSNIYISNLGKNKADIWWITESKDGTPAKTMGSIVIASENYSNQLNNFQLGNNEIQEIGLGENIVHFVSLNGVVANQLYSYYLRSGGITSIKDEVDPASILFGFSVSNHSPSFIEPQISLFNPGLPLSFKIPSTPKNKCIACGRNITGEIKDPDGNPAAGYIVNFNISVNNNLTSWLTSKTNEEGKWIIDLANAVIVNGSCSSREECTSIYPELPAEFALSNFTITSPEGNTVQYDNVKVGKDDVIATQEFKPENICGNNIIEGKEECDDGNTLGNDSCSEVCKSTFVLSAQDSKVIIDTNLTIPNLNVPVNYLMRNSENKLVAKGEVNFIYKTNRIVIELDKESLPAGSYTLSLTPQNYSAVESKVDIDSEGIIKLELTSQSLPGDFYTQDGLNVINEKDLSTANSYLQDKAGNKDKDLNGDNQFNEKDIELLKTSIAN